MAKGKSFGGMGGGMGGGNIQQLMRQAQKMQEQAEKFGTVVKYDDVESVDLTGDVKRVTVADGTVYEAQSLIFATGSAYRKLGLPEEDRLSGHGLSGCATCDGFFFKEKTIVVAGGGDSAMEEATFLTRFASKVIVVHRRDSLRASKIMQERAFENPKIEFVWNTEITAILGDDSVTGVTLRDTVTGDERDLPIDGLFVAIGNDPRTKLIHGQLDLNPDGTIAVQGRSSKTSLAGVFAAGDVIDPTYRQAVTAAATGTIAALDAEHYLAALGG
jgi:thioredoxin reductase (NADPH)